MEIYIVIEKQETVYHDEFKHRSFENRSDALNYAVGAALGSAESISLYQVLSLNTNTNKVTDLELSLEEGSFSFKQAQKGCHVI